jgi:hypothetical protein
MTDLTLRPGETTETRPGFLSELLKEMFSVTPLGMLLAILRDKR